MMNTSGETSSGFLPCFLRWTAILGRYYKRELLLTNSCAHTARTLRKVVQKIQRRIGTLSTIWDWTGPHWRLAMVSLIWSGSDPSRRCRYVVGVHAYCSSCKAVLHFTGTVFRLGLKYRNYVLVLIKLMVMDPSHFSFPSSPSSVLQPPYPSRAFMNGNRSIPATVPSAKASKVSTNFSTSISKPTHHCISSSPGTTPQKTSMLCTQKKSTRRTRGKNGRFESSSDPRNRSCVGCGTSETTQWRTGSDGTILCNPCGPFTSVSSTCFITLTFQ